MKIINTPSATTPARSSVVVFMGLDLDRHDAADDQVADEDHERADGKEDPTDDASEHRLEIGRRHEEHERREQDRQRRDDGARGFGLRGQGLNLALDAHPLPDCVRDVVQDLGEVATDRAVDRVRGRHQVEVRARDALGDVRQRLVGRAAEVHLTYGAPELVADRRHRVLRHGVDGLRERVASFQRIRQQCERVAELAVELPQTLADPVFDVETRDQVTGEEEQREERSPTPEADQTHEDAAAKLDHEVLGRTQLQVSPLQLLGDGRLPFLHISAAHAIGRGLKEAVHRVAQTCRRRQRLRTGGRRHSVGREPGLKVFGAACAPAHLADAEKEEEDARKGDQPEHHRDRPHLNSPQGSVQLIRRWLFSSHENLLRNVFAFGSQVLHAHRQHTVRSVVTDRLALGVDADLLEVEELLELDFTVFDAGDLGHAHDPAHAAPESRLLDDQVDRRADRLADGTRRKVLTCLEDKRLQTHKALARVVGVDGRHRAIVTGVHGLEHVQRLSATTLTDDDPVGAHTQTALDELAYGPRALALDVGRSRLELDPVRLLELQLGRVLTGDKPLVLRDERRQDV